MNDKALVPLHGAPMRRSLRRVRRIRRKKSNIELHRRAQGMRARLLGRGGEEGLAERLIRSAKRHFLLYPIVTALVLLLAAGIFFFSASCSVHHVMLEHDGVSVTVSSFHATVGDILERQGITIGAYDRVTPDPDAPLKGDCAIVVERAVPVTLVDGEEEPRICYAVGGTVAELLEKNGCLLGELDEVTPAGDAQIYANMQIRVDRITQKEEARHEAIAFETEVRKTDALYVNEEKVDTEGQDGERMVVETVTFRNGVEEARAVKEETVLREPVTEIILQGTKARPVVRRPSVTGTNEEESVLTLSDGRVLSYSGVISVNSTAYTHTGHNTATGSVPAYGTVAVDPSVIPLGTRMYIPGYGIGVARDTGGAIKGARIDVFFETFSEAKNWGRRNVKVYILK